MYTGLDSILILREGKLSQDHLAYTSALMQDLKESANEKDIRLIRFRDGRFQEFLCDHWTDI